MAGDRDRVRARAQRMQAEGYSEQEIREFVRKARARAAGPKTPGTSARDIASQQLAGSDAPPGFVGPPPLSGASPTPGSMVDNAPRILSDQPYAEYDEQGFAVVPPESLAFERQSAPARAVASIRGQDPAAQRKIADLRQDPGIEGLRHLEAATRGFGAGMGGGMLLSGPLRALGLAGEAALPARVVAGVAPAARVVAPAIEGAGGGALGSAVTAKALNQPVGPAAEEGAYVGGALGPLAAAASELVSSGFRGVSNLLRRNKQIGTHARAVERGAYEDPEMKALAEPEPGHTGAPSPELQIRRAADKATDRVVGRIQEIKGQNGEDYQAAVKPPYGPQTPKGPVTEEVPYTPDPEWRARLPGRTRGPSFKGAGRTPNEIPVEGPSFPQEGLAAHVDRPALEAELQAARARNINPDTGRPFNKHIESRISALIDDLGPKSETVNTDVHFERAKPTTTEGALGTRRSLKAEAAFDSAAPSTEQKAARTAYGAYRGAVRKAAPHVAAADDQFAAVARKMNRAEQIVGVEDEILQQSRPLTAEEAPFELADDLEPGATWSLPVAKAKQAARNLGRVGDNNIPGVEANKYLRELAEMDPEFAKALQFIADKKALEATKYGFHGHLPESLHSVKAAVGPALRQNVRALGDDIEQLASGAAEGTSGPGVFAPSLALKPFMRAIEAEQERKRRGLAALGRGQNAITRPRAPN